MVRGGYQPITGDDDSPDRLPVEIDSFSGLSREESLAQQPSRRSCRAPWYVNRHPVLIYSLLIGFFFHVLLKFMQKHGVLSSPNVTHLTRKSPWKWIDHPMPRSPLWGNVEAPYPTGAFFTNLVVGKGEAPIALHPYGVKTSSDGVEVSYGPTRRVVTDLAITDPFDTDLQLTARESYKSRGVKKYDKASVTMGFELEHDAFMSAPLVKGSPYVTVEYTNSRPVVAGDSMIIITAEKRLYGDAATGGEQYILTLGNGQRWLVFFSNSDWGVEVEQGSNTLAATKPKDGFIRVALIPPGSQDDAAFGAYMEYVRKYPIAVEITPVPPSAAESTSCELVVNFISSDGGDSASDWSDLLMFMLPHQIKLSQGAELVEVNALNNIVSMKGKLQAVVGNKWVLAYPLDEATPDYDYMLPAGALSDESKEEIIEHLKSDLKAVPVTATDPYSFGKEIARLARLAFIADHLGDNGARSDAMEDIVKAITPWLTGSNDNALLYDRTYGGIVPTNGVQDASADFGSGWYNDHHFHYGYFIYAASAIVKFDPAFYHKHRHALDSLVRDVCSYEYVESTAEKEADKETIFPFARHKDFFDGHSWASGLSPQANGKGQESTSEAVNAYYACHLYGRATNNTELANFARMLLAMEVQATLIYWHMSDDSIYDSFFSASIMVGNLGAFDATTTTWFGSNLEYVHGIQEMPLTPASALLFHQDFVQYQWPLLASRLSVQTTKKRSLLSDIQRVQMHEKPGRMCWQNNQCYALGHDSGHCCPTEDGIMLQCCENTDEHAGHPVPLKSPPPYAEAPLVDEWRGLLYTLQAVVDKDVALRNIRTMNDFGNGGSKSNALLWAYSCPEKLNDYDDSPRQVERVVAAECDRNSACQARGNVGLCCPAPEGWNEYGHYNSSMLSCCPTLMKT